MNASKKNNEQRPVCTTMAASFSVAFGDVDVICVHLTMAYKLNWRHSLGVTVCVSITLRESDFRSRMNRRQVDAGVFCYVKVFLLFTQISYEDNPSVFSLSFYLKRNIEFE